MGSLKFPENPNELTAGWLSDALGFDTGPFELTRIGAGRGNMGDLVCVSFEADHPSIVAKFSADNLDSLATAKRSGLNQREVEFYLRMATRLSIRCPDCYGAWYDPETARCLLLLENIESPIELDTVAGIGVERTRQVLAELALLHRDGFRYAHEAWLEQLALQDMTFEPRLRNLSSMIERGWPKLMDLCGDLVPAAMGLDLAPRLVDMMLGMADLPTTFVHGDAKPDNLVATGHAGSDGEQMVVLDWQAVGKGPPCWDVASIMINCLTVEDRRAYEDELLSSYPHDLEGYSEALLFGLVVATALTLLGDPSQPRREQLIRTVATRSVAALQDHGKT
ncbi:MAG: aminoglycoside phosphotransferase family protein [Acidimicrobiales bacterium]